MKIAVDLECWRANAKVDAVMPVPRDGAAIAYRFMLPGRSDVVTCNVIDDGANIELFPDRSSAHRALRDALNA